MIQDNLYKIRETISEVATHCNRNPEDIRLVAVSKRFPVEVMREAIAAGQVIFGENYIQEAVQKKNLLGEVVKLHFIGNLQSNKAKFAVDTCSMVETVDRLKIAKAMNRYLEETERSLDVLIQVNIGLDQNKSGVSPDESETLLKKIRDLPRLRVRGLMTMPPFMEDPEAVRPFFRDLRRLSEKMEDKGLLGDHGKTELSMGMSHDYQVAIEEGATLIRVGTAIFGQRPAPEKQQ
jgi:pyridoxal phosphate enzyme (YggS family)